MTVFQYPKSKIKRKLSPRQFKRYQSYKPYLQEEFSRVCVYCRQPDSSAPNLNFGVDHYRPKGIPRFASLVCNYENLYYCCGNCNSRKSDDWPVDENIGPFVVNPCDYEMASHLRFVASTGRVDSRTAYGKHTEELLQLNDDIRVQYRRYTLKIVSLFIIEIEKMERQLKALTTLLKEGKISQTQFDAEEQDINQDIADLRHTLQSQTGDLPLSPLRMKRLGVS